MPAQESRSIGVIGVGFFVLSLPLAALAQVADMERIKQVLPEGMELPEPPAAQTGTVIEPAAPIEAARSLAPALNEGFLNLGPAGTKGEVDGPGSQGNGTYEVVKNDPYEIQLIVKTGYIDCRFILSRDPAMGQDAMRVAGKKWDKDKNQWGPEKDTAVPAEIRYDKAKDRGLLRYQKNGEWEEERFWGNEEGDRMTIEFSGGWNHEFKPTSLPAPPAPESLAEPAVELEPQ